MLVRGDDLTLSYQIRNIGNLACQVPGRIDDSSRDLGSVIKAEYREYDIFHHTAKSLTVAPTADARLSTQIGPLVARPPALGFGGTMTGGWRGEPSVTPPSVHASFLIDISSKDI
jgi:hypothetical protein